jgi:hypothetical protein
MLRRIVLTVSVLALLFVGAGADAQTTQTVHYDWTAPTSGSPVDHYIIQHRADGGAWVQIATSVTPEYDLIAEYLVAHEIRVCGVDKVARLGPWSLPSDPYTPDAGAPGGCGQPKRRV